MREQLGLSRDDFSRALRCGIASVYRWEKKDPPGFHGELLEMMARCLELAPDAERKRWGRGLVVIGSFGLIPWLRMLGTPPWPAGAETEGSAPREKLDPHSEAVIEEMKNLVAEFGVRLPGDANESASVMLERARTAKRAAPTRTHGGDDDGRFVEVPILGRVAAGLPIEPDEHGRSLRERLEAPSGSGVAKKKSGRQKQK